MTTVQITISDALAKEAAAEGLLETGSIEALLRERLAAARVAKMQATRQRLQLQATGTPPMTAAEIEAEIVTHEGLVDSQVAEKLVQIAQRSRNLKGHGLDEGMSTRLLVYAAQLIGKGVDPQSACRMALVRPLTDDPDMRDTLDAAVSTFF